VDEPRTGGDVYTIDLSGKTALVAGVANQRSLAWGIARELAAAGARMMLTYQNERLKASVEKLASELPECLLYECDVSKDESLDEAFEKISADTDRLDIVVHAVAFAKKEELEGEFSGTSREGFHLALDVSAYSLLAMARRAAPLMKEGGSILTLTFLASQRALPNYNVMGTAKAALEHIVRQLAFELGPRGIRVNAISAGPVPTISARGISGFSSMLRYHAEKAPLRRNISSREVGTCALFLASDLASGITGETIFVDAGFHIVV
jgi:enoyl-[acyl-carrier protein] reductase I